MHTIFSWESRRYERRGQRETRAVCFSRWNFGLSCSILTGCFTWRSEIDKHKHASRITDKSAERSTEIARNRRASTHLKRCQESLLQLVNVLVRHNRRHLYQTYHGKGGSFGAGLPVMMCLCGKSRKGGVLRPVAAIWIKRLVGLRKVRRLDARAIFCIRSRWWLWYIVRLGGTGHGAVMLQQEDESPLSSEVQFFVDVVQSKFKVYCNNIE